MRWTAGSLATLLLLSAAVDPTRAKDFDDEKPSRKAETSVEDFAWDDERPIQPAAFEPEEDWAEAADPESLFGEPPAPEPIGESESTELPTELSPAPARPHYHFAQPDRPWTGQVLPRGLLYRDYLANPHAPRMASVFLYDTTRNGWVWDSSLGAQVGLFRYGSTCCDEGWQLDLLGAAFPRLDVENKDDLEAVDFRIGLPITYRKGATSYKIGYDHISSHVGDEFIVRNPTFQRINYVRDGVIVGVAHNTTPDTRVYGETSFAFNADGGAEPWGLQFGAEYSPAIATGFRPQPFAAVNTHLREEHDWGGTFTAMTGCQWRGEHTKHLFRFGLQYANGKSLQGTFYDEHEELFGTGLWLDF